MSNQIPDHTPSVEVELLDRFVDGELNGDAQRAVLARLDDDAGGWRRLALAFVESQALGVELRGTVDRAPAESGEHDGASTELNRSTSSSAIAWPRMLSLAASLLLCVGVGFAMGREWHARTTTILPGERPSVPIARSPADAEIEPADMDSQVDAPRGLVTVHTHDGVPVQLPVYDAAQGGENMLTSTESAVPYEVIRALRSRGHDVKQNRRLWPIDLGDGRKIIVPVDQLDVEYVGYNAYQ